jgi:tetrahydromethanopterin S-methyltransferase subunit G
VKNYEPNAADERQRTIDEKQKEFKKHNNKLAYVFAEYGQTIGQTANRWARPNG